VGEEFTDITFGSGSRLRDSTGRHRITRGQIVSIVWVLLFLPLGDEPPARDIHIYATEAQCKEVLADVITHGFASVEELGCERRAQTP
jgi:hypothetical protein